MSFTIRPLDLPSDYGPLANLMTVIQGAPVSPDDLVEEDRQIPTVSALAQNESGQLTGFGRARFLALSPDGQALGYAFAWRAPWTPPGDVSSLFGVHPAARRQGIGRALVQAIEGWARSIGANDLWSMQPDHPAGVEAFLEKAGFRIDAYVQRFILNLADHHPATQQPTVEGVRLYTLAEVPETERPSVEAKLYELYAETLQDNPGHLGGLPSFTEWRKDALPDQRTAPELVFLAAAEDRLIGVTTLFRTKDPAIFYTDYTGVDRSYRGKGIARILKDRSFAVALELGAQTMETEIVASNRPMQQLGRTMGYRAAGGTYRIVKSLR
jgi:GNAT superfamily N-acetyltransferase